MTNARNRREAARRLPHHGIERLQPARPAQPAAAGAGARGCPRAGLPRPGAARANAPARQYVSDRCLFFDEPLTYAFRDPAAVLFLQGVASACERVGASVLVVPRSPETAAHELIRNALVDGFIADCEA